MKHKWTQTQILTNKWNRLYRAQQIIEIARITQLLDILEPITDLTEANIYLNKFLLERN